MSHAPASISSYLAIFVSLLVLTAVTVWASSVDFGALNTPIALGIAGVKATLVAVFFMHLNHSSRLTALIAAAGVLWLAIMIALTMADYASRIQVMGWQ